MPVTGHLKQPTQAAARKPAMCCLYLVLLPAGFTLPLPLPAARCALTAPFTLTLSGGLLSVALSLESPPPDVIRHRASVEPGLSSPLARARSPDCLTPKADYGETDPRSSAAGRDTRHKPASASRHRPARPRMRPEMTLKSTDYSAHLRAENTVMSNIIAIGAQSLLQAATAGVASPVSRSPPLPAHCLRPQADPFACERRPIQRSPGLFCAPVPHRSAPTPCRAQYCGA